MWEQGGGLDFQLSLCNLAGQIVVPLPGKVPQNFCEPGRAGVVREIHPLGLHRALSVCREELGCHILFSAALQQKNESTDWKLGSKVAMTGYIVLAALRQADGQLSPSVV